MGKNITIFFMSLAFMLDKIRLSNSDVGTQADTVFIYVWAGMAVLHAIIIVADALT